MENSWTARNQAKEKSHSRKIKNYMKEFLKTMKLLKASSSLRTHTLIKVLSKTGSSTVMAKLKNSLE